MSEKSVLSMKIDSVIRDEFSEYCESIGLSQSQVIAALIKGLMSGDLTLVLDNKRGLVPVANKER